MQSETADEAMHYLRNFLFAAVLVASVCLGGQYLVTRNAERLPLWFARYALSTKQYHRLVARRQADNLAEIEERLWNLYDQTILRDQLPTPADLSDLAGWIEGVEVKTEPMANDTQLSIRLHATFVAAELAPPTYNAVFQQTIQSIRERSSDLLAEAELLALCHQHNLRETPTEQLFRDLAAYAAQHPHSDWGVELFTTVSEQLLRSGYPTEAERVLILGREHYGRHRHGGRLYHTLAPRKVSRSH